MLVLPRAVTSSTSSIPAAAASSTTYWSTGRSTTLSISLGTALVAGRKRVASPAAGITALTARARATLSGMRPRLSGGPGARGGCLTRRAACQHQWGGRRHRPAGQHARVPTCGFGRVQGLIGGVEQIRAGPAVTREDGDSDRDRHPNVNIVRAPPVHGERCLPDGGADPAGDGQAAGHVGFGEQHHELLAALAERVVHLAHGAPE